MFVLAVSDPLCRLDRSCLMCNLHINGWTCISVLLQCLIAN